MLKNIYILITAARNEENLIENTIKSVISQSIKPAKWIIVSDNSTDRTDIIVEGYAKTHRINTGFIVPELSIGTLHNLIAQ